MNNSLPQSNRGGRHKDPIWALYDELAEDGKIVGQRCKQCNAKVSSKVKRLKTHYEKCQNNPNNKKTNKRIRINMDFSSSSDSANEYALNSSEKSTVPCTLSQSKIDNFTIETNSEQKKLIDQAIAAYFYARNVPFNHIEDFHFKKMIAALRPGYDNLLPTRKQLAGNLLDNMMEDATKETKEVLKDKSVTLIQDGWSNIHNQPIIANCLSDGKNVYFLSAVDTGSKQKTTEFCKKIAQEAITEAKEKYCCNVVSFVCDNENKMKKMRCNLEKDQNNQENEDNYIFSYGCAAHYLNLLGGDICQERGTSLILGHVTEVSKYFRNHHRANGLLTKQTGSRKPQLPSETRWNSQVDCLDIFIKNRPFYMQTLIMAEEDEENVLEQSIKDLITNVALFVNVKDLHKQLSFISRALDRLQSDRASIADATKEFIDLLNEETLTPYKKKIIKRYKECITPHHKLAYMLHPKFMGTGLRDSDIEEARKYVEERFSSNFLPLITLFSIKEKPFPSSFFSDAMVQLNPINWWEALKQNTKEDNSLDNSFLVFASNLFKSCASSAGIGRIFSNFGFLQSKVRNRLDLKTLTKLVTMYQILNLKSKKFNGTIDFTDY